MSRLKSLKAISVMALLATAAAPALADDDIAAKFSNSVATSQVQVEYSPIDQFIGAFCDENSGRVQCAYDAMGQQGDRYLTRFETYLSRVPVSRLSKDDQLAYWLNTRNMLVVHAIAESRSRKLTKARGTFAAPGEMWTKKRITVEGVELSIQDIERDILLASFDDPNLIYGMYQGTKGGPAMHNTGFTGSSVHADLEKLGQSFVNSRSGLRVSKSKANINAIYDWYGDALFDGDDAKFKAHLASLAKGKRASGLNNVSEFKSAKFSYSVDNFVVRQQSPASRAAGGVTGGGVGGGYGS